MLCAQRRFRELMKELLRKREVFGGPLSQETEAKIAAKLNLYWEAMSIEEQDETEREFAQ